MRTSLAWALGFLLVTGAIARAEDAAAPTPQWLTTYPEAEKAAQKDWKPILMEAGREA